MPSPHVVRTVTRLAREIVDARMKLRPNCAARTVAADIVPIIEISQKVGIPIEVACFIGSSPIRQYAEDWNLGRMLRMTEEAVSLAVREGLPVMYVTEDTIRAQPDHIRQMYTTAIRAGAGRVCVCDTVGHATPNGVQNLIRFVSDLVREINPEVKVDWHGHQDHKRLSLRSTAWESTNIVLGLRTLHPRSRPRTNLPGIRDSDTVTRHSGRLRFVRSRSNLRDLFGCLNSPEG